MRMSPNVNVIVIVTTIGTKGDTVVGRGLVTA